METLGKVHSVLEELRRRHDVQCDVDDLREQQNAVRICADFLPTDNSKFLLGSLHEGTEVVYEREDTTDDQPHRFYKKSISHNRSEKKRKQRERKRKSRAKLVEKDGIVKTNQEWENIRRASLRIANRIPRKKALKSTLLAPVNATTPFCAPEDVSKAYMQVCKTTVTVKDTVHNIPITNPRCRGIVQRMHFDNHCVYRDKDGNLKRCTVSRNR